MLGARRGGVDGHCAVLVALVVRYERHERGRGIVRDDLRRARVLRRRRAAARGVVSLHGDVVPGPWHERQPGDRRVERRFILRDAPHRVARLRGVEVRYRRERARVHGAGAGAEAPSHRRHDVPVDPVGHDGEIESVGVGDECGGGDPRVDADARRAYRRDAHHRPTWRHRHWPAHFPAPHCRQRPAVGVCRSARTLDGKVQIRRVLSRWRKGTAERANRKFRVLTLSHEISREDLSVNK